MSSMYRLICLSHDPGLTLDTEWHSGANGRAAAEADLRHPGESAHEEVRQHARCDLIIGRYSCPLVEVGYLPYNTNVHWIDSAWVRPLAMLAATEPTDLRLPGGWTWPRLLRLHGELGIDSAADRG
jgi:hypothetical protein